MPESVTVVLPSRTQPAQVEFLRRSVGSVRAQEGAPGVRLEVVVAVDAGAPRPEGLDPALGVLFVEARARSQASALNAGLAAATGDVIAMLEDDDAWAPGYLREALAALGDADFVSSTQAEEDATGALLAINDFPTPSGWCMRATLRRAVGDFDETYRWHLDNDWLGRLAERNPRRVHLVEATAPVDATYARKVRPWLANVLQLGGGATRLVRHASPWPLVRRLVHTGSGTHAIGADPEVARASQREVERLLARYGRIPW